MGVPFLANSETYEFESGRRDGAKTSALVFPQPRDGSDHRCSDTKPRAQRLSRLGGLWLGHPNGAISTVAKVAATGSLIVWALDEVVRGVNPWRRFLGVAVLIYVSTRSFLDTASGFH
jgi:hypothetical protein